MASWEKFITGLDTSIYVSFRGWTLRLRSRRLALFLFQPRSHFVDFSGVKTRLDVRRVIFLDHLDAGATVFRNLVDVGTFHQAETAIGVPQALGRSRPSFAIGSEAFLVRIILNSSRGHFGKIRSLGFGRDLVRGRR